MRETKGVKDGETDLRETNDSVTQVETVMTGEQIARS